MKNSFTSKPFNAFIYGSMPLIPEDEEGLWDGYMGSLYIRSGSPHAANINDNNLLYRGILIDVSTLNTGDQIKITMSSDGDYATFASLTDTIDALPFPGSFLIKTPITGSYDSQSLTGSPFEYTYTKIATSNTIMFYYGNATWPGEGDKVVSVEKV